MASILLFMLRRDKEEPLLARVVLPPRKVENSMAVLEPSLVVSGHNYPFEIKCASKDFTCNLFSLSREQLIYESLLKRLSSLVPKEVTIDDLIVSSSLIL